MVRFLSVFKGWGSYPRKIIHLAECHRNLFWYLLHNNKTVIFPIFTCKKTEAECLSDLPNITQRLRCRQRWYLSSETCTQAKPGRLDALQLNSESLPWWFAILPPHIKQCVRYTCEKLTNYVMTIQNESDFAASVNRKCVFIFFLGLGINITAFYLLSIHLFLHALINIYLAPSVCQELLCVMKAQTSHVGYFCGCFKPLITCSLDTWSPSIT